MEGPRGKLRKRYKASCRSPPPPARDQLSALLAVTKRILSVGNQPSHDMNGLVLYQKAKF